MKQNTIICLLPRRCTSLQLLEIIEEYYNKGYEYKGTCELDATETGIVVRFSYAIFQRPITTK
jgi:hypothetical protein